MKTKFYDEQHAACARKVRLLAGTGDEGDHECRRSGADNSVVECIRANIYTAESIGRLRLKGFMRTFSRADIPEYGVYLHRFTGSAKKATAGAVPPTPIYIATTFFTTDIRRHSGIRWAPCLWRRNAIPRSTSLHVLLRANLSPGSSTAMGLEVIFFSAEDLCDAVSYTNFGGHIVRRNGFHKPLHCFLVWVYLIPCFHRKYLFG